MITSRLIGMKTTVIAVALGVRTEVVAGCLPVARVISETAAYNRVMEDEIGKRFGEHALDEIQKEARAALTGES